jgi:hypothetical protein
MKRKFRIIVGMLLLAIPLCVNAQVKIKKPGQDSNEAKEERTEQERPEKPKDGFGMPKISGFVQGLYQANLNDKGELGDNTFRMRRVRLSVDGKLSKTVSYKIQGDFVRGPMLVDGFVKYKPCNEFAIQVGQFKTPFTLESPINPVNLEIFDYGEIIQQFVGYSDICGIKAIGRDIGVMATGGFIPMMNEDKIDYNIIDYAVGVFNGNGVNTTDNNKRKDIVGRLEVHPGMKALTLSGSYYRGQYKTTDDQGARNRWSAGAQYNDGKLVVRGEYIDGTTGYYNDIVDPEGNPIEQYRFSNGYYGVLGYNFQAGEQKIMPVLRYEHFAPGDKNGVVFGETNYYTAGINYWPLKSVNFKLDYSLIQHILDEKTNSHRVVGILSYKF